MDDGDEPRIPFEAQLQGHLQCFRIYAERGITSAGIAGGSAQSFRLYEAVRDAGSPVRMGFMYSEGSFPALKAIGIKSGFGNDRLRATSIKVFHGNSLSGRTRWLSEEYSDQPVTSAFRPRAQADLDKAFQAMHDAGFQIATHSERRPQNRDGAHRHRARAGEKSAPDARHRIEHASVMNQPMLERARHAGAILVFHSYMWEHGGKLASYGEKRLVMIHPYRTAIDMGIHVAGHSESTVSAADPLLRIEDMVTRKGENGIGYGVNRRVSVKEAIKVWTLDGAYATFEEHDKGSIAPGKLADFVVLRKDPRKVSPDTIKDIMVDATYIRGKNAWQAPRNALAVIHHLVPGIDFGDGDEEENLNHVR